MLCIQITSIIITGLTSKLNSQYPAFGSKIPNKPPGLQYN